MPEGIFKTDEMPKVKGISAEPIAPVKSYLSKSDKEDRIILFLFIFCPEFTSNIVISCLPLFTKIYSYACMFLFSLCFNLYFLRIT